MSENGYKVHKYWVEEAEFEILILEIPKGDLEDKLAYLARDKGNITKSFYEDFVISTCVANINQLLYHIKQQAINPPDLLKVREEITGAILSINPLLDPSNLVINRNSVIKLKDGELGEGDRPLDTNKNWNLSYYDDAVDRYNGDPDAADPVIDVNGKEVPPKETKPLDELDYDLQKKWWNRIRRYLEIKAFKETDMESILKQRYFHNRSSFQTFIVSVCVDDADGLYTMLDEMGIPQRVAPPILMHEVYELCKEINPFLTYENAQKLSEGLDDNEDDSGKRGKKKSPNRMSSHAKSQANKKKKNKKKFKDVPKEDLLKLGDAMKVFLIGQDEAVEKLVDSIQRASVGLKDPERPIGSFLFAGRTGIGKTLATKVLADELIKDRNNLITIDCSEYSADHEYAKLIGAPSGYIGHDQGGILTNAIIESPFSVVVFDEVEKASNKVHELMLQILEEGRLTDGKGQAVSFKDAVIIMTSNIGVSEVDSIKKTVGFGDVAKITEDKKDKAIDDALKKKFKPEFLNRIDAVINFRSLAKKDYMRIIDLELYKLNDNLRNNDTEYKKLTLEFDVRVKNYIYKNGIDEDYGARPLKRCIEKEVSTLLARKLLKEKVPTNATIKVSAYKGKPTFKVVKNAEEVFATEEHKEMAKATE
jgi:ATP-dependent Clp protease ATP-binding subunit ClpC